MFEYYLPSRGTTRTEREKNPERKELLTRLRTLGGGMSTVSVEDVNGLSSGHLDVLHCVALPGPQSLPFPGSDQHHARLTSVAVNLETRRIRKLPYTHRHTDTQAHRHTDKKNTCRHTDKQLHTDA